MITPSPNIIGRSAAVFLAILLSSCGGFFPSSTAIVSLSISPTGAWIKPTTQQQFSATARFGNNSTGDVTSSVTWTSSATSIATIDTSGLATAVALGNTTITAKSGSVSANATLTVSNRTIKSITVNPPSATINFSSGGQTQQAFTANATFDDNTSADVTSQAAWNSSVQGVATVNGNGVATAVATGNTTISASLGGQTGTASLTVQ